MQVTKLKQPPGLYYLFAAEMWERFGFYTVQALLTNIYKFPDAQAYGLFGAYMALIYFTPHVAAGPRSLNGYTFFVSSVRMPV